MPDLDTSVRLTTAEGTVPFAAEKDSSGRYSLQSVPRLNGEMVSQLNPLPVATVGGRLSSSVGVEGHNVFAVQSSLVYGVSATGLSDYGWLMLFDTNQVPPDGPVTPSAVALVTQLAGAQINFGGAAALTNAGVVVVLSSTGPFVKTSGPTGFLSVLMR